MIDLLNYHWEKYVGRRQPPLRGELAFRGVLRWLKDKCFEGDYSKLYIFFSTITDKGVISDHFINTNLKKKITDMFERKLVTDINYGNVILQELVKDTEALKKFSLKLHTIKEFDPESLSAKFEEFCKIWENFGPNLYIFLLVIEACENIILQDFMDSPEMKTQLMKRVASQVKSEFFAKNTSRKESIANENNFPIKYLPYIELLSRMMEYRDYRKVIYDDSWYKYSRQFITALENRIGSKELTLYLSKKDITRLLEKSESNTKVVLPCLVYAQDNEIILRYGTDVEKIRQSIFNSMQSEDGYLKGMIACQGRSVGKVRLIEPHVKNQIFEKGEIMVTKMTTPDLMPLIKIASAIVTDEGGITCHAAIVSRELEKPCIIGTKIATIFLKDGDFIEVDANKGIIKKITRP